MPVAAAVAIGGALGALSRYGIDTLIERNIHGLFPRSTFTINVTGCFFNGLVVAVVVDALHARRWLGVGLVIGFLGACTTFSTFGAETYELLELRHYLLAIGNVAVSATAGVGAVMLGQWLGRL